VNILDSHRHHSVEALEQIIYQHLLECVRLEAPDQVLQRFQTLFVQGGTYPDAEIRMALQNLMRSGQARQNFLPFFNRCCFILINRWQMNLLQREAVVQLVEILHQCRGPSVIVGQPSPAGRLRFMVQEYARSPLFQKLRQLADFLNPKNDHDERRPLSSLLYRYPYLYGHCLTNQEDTEEYQKMIVTAQQSAKQKFEQDLASYLTYALIQDEKSQPKTITTSGSNSPHNPTLLNHQELCSTLKQYVAKVDARGTYQDMAQQFWAPGRQPQSYGAFKGALYDYVIGSIPAKFGQSRFNVQLKSHLDHLYPDSDAGAVNDFLIVRTCNQLLNFMVIESRQRPNHTVFMNLLNNLGSTVTIGLLLKVVLLTRKVKPYLERRLSILFQHYEAHTRGSVQWLVTCLEKLNLAWTAHFSSQNLSYVNLL
jgi:hypothetical protein